MFKKISERIELGLWVEPIFGVGLTFTKRGFHILVGPLNVDFRFYTIKDLAKRERMLTTWLTGLKLVDDDAEDDDL